MQTMIEIDDQLLSQAVNLARDRGCELSAIIEESLREKMSHSPNAYRPANRSVSLTTYGSEGLRPGVDLNNSAALADLIEQRA